MDVKLPRLGEGADSGIVVNILVSEGDQISQDQTILELENEKAVAPIPSPAAGKVQKIHVKEGDEITVGQLLISLSEAGEAQPAKAKPTAAAAAAPAPAAAEGKQTPAPAGEYRYESKSAAPPPTSPSIRKTARELGIDLTRVQGSAAGGRITLADVKAYIERLQQIAFGGKPAAEARPPQPWESIDFSKWGPVSKKPISPLRRTVAERTSDAWATVPHVFQFAEADITSLMELRKKYAPQYEKKGARLTLTALALKAALKPLRKFPIFNASLDERSHETVYKEYYHIGVAVDTESGLIVPVIKDVDKKRLLDISKELAELAERTRLRKVSLEELQGGTLTLSNLGGIGGSYFTPIIYKPQSAVIGLAQGAWKAVVRDGKVEPRLMLPVTVSYDHRLIDGADGARFIRELVDALENFKEAEFKLEGK